MSNEPLSKTGRYIIAILLFVVAITVIFFVSQDPSPLTTIKIIIPAIFIVLGLWFLLGQPFQSQIKYGLREDDQQLIEATAAEDLDKAKELLENGADPNAPESGDGSALIYAVDLGNIEIVKLLLQYKANVNHQDEANGNALEVAAFAGSREIVELLIQAGADVNAKSFLDGTALGYAISSGNNEIAEILRRAGAKEPKDDRTSRAK